MSALRLAIAGCRGRMGQTLLRVAAEDPALRIVAALTRADDPAIGAVAAPAAGDAPAVLVSAQPAQPCDVLLDFSQPEGLLQWLGWCEANRVPLVSGTTGLGAAHHAALDRAAGTIPLLWAPNTSLGVTLLLHVVESVAAALPSAGWDAEIVETHHRFKIDAPSGTAKALHDRVVRGRARFGAAPPPSADGPRVAGSIGVHSVRMGDVVGEHQVHFSSLGETLTLSHTARSRDIFARGALEAARWIAGRPPGRYTMRDVIRLAE